MNLLVTGASGQLGSELRAIGSAHPGVASLVAVRRNDLLLTDARQVRAAVAALGPDAVVINAAGWTDVDGAETAERKAYAVNATAPAVLAAACAEAGALLLHVSTDYVFAGDRVGGPPYAPGDQTGPATAYGRTKLAGEQAVRALHPDGGHIVRTAWLYGRGRNFVRTMAALADRPGTVDVVDDQRGNPTWARDLAGGLLALATLRPPAATWHLTGAGEATWYDLAREVFRLCGHDPDRVRPTTSDTYVRPARRPAYSVLDGTAWGAAVLPESRPWAVSLEQAIREGDVV